MNINELEKILEKCWCRETIIQQAGWKEDNPALGQCVPTSLVVNDYFGGEIIWAMATLQEGKEISHYFNKIDEKEIDLTRKQFPEGTIIPAGIPRTKGFKTTRDYLLSSQNVVERYNLLKLKVEKFLVT